MESAVHRFSDMFAQLGLPNDDVSIRNFLLSHSPLPDGVHLPDAAFWSPSQASFLRDSLAQDSDWVAWADQLSQALRSPDH